MGERGITAIANDNRDSFARTMKTLKERGWMRSGIDCLKTWALADNLGMILSDVTRYKTDGSVLESSAHATWFVSMATRGKS